MRSGHSSLGQGAALDCPIPPGKWSMRTRRPLRRSWTTRGCCRPRVVLPPTRRAAPEKLHVIPPGVFQDLKSDRWNHAVFSTPKKSEGTQITCDIVGEPFVGESLGGRSEGARRASEVPRRGLGGTRPEPSLFRAASHVRGIEAHVVALEKSHVRERKLRESVRVQIWVCEEFLHVGVVASRDGTEGAVG